MSTPDQLATSMVTSSKDEDGGSITQATNSTGKKAVHVKWAGKTIALGTFENKEADEKCARAKALTRTWRSTMRPKPSREWVMLELERLHVRVVSGRLGRKSARDDSSSDDSDEESDDSKKRRKSKSKKKRNSMNNMMMSPRNHMGLSNGGNMLMPGMGNSLMDNTSNGMLDYSSMSLNSGLQGNHGGMNMSMPSPGDQYGGISNQNNNNNGIRNNDGNDEIIGSLGMGMSSSSGGFPAMNSHQHYEMLKLHHMNLLNEIQETTMMMNLYQKQHLQQLSKQRRDSRSGDSTNGDLFNSSSFGSNSSISANQDPKQNVMNGMRLGPAGVESIQMQNLLRQQQELTKARQSRDESYNMGMQNNNQDSLDILQNQFKPETIDNVTPSVKVNEKPSNDQSSILEKLKRDIAALQQQANKLEGMGNSGDSNSNKRKLNMDDHTMSNKLPR